MKERPLIMSPEMVGAILAGIKTQTRRVLNPQPSDMAMENTLYVDALIKTCRHGQLGDHLWVRHNWWHYKPHPSNPGNEQAWDEMTDTVRWPSGEFILNCEPIILNSMWKKKPSIFMPRWASRITLEITNVKIDRLQNMSDEEAIYEGCPPVIATVAHPKACLAWFRTVWDRLNVKRGFGWETNPWVWIISFKVIES